MEYRFRPNGLLISGFINDPENEAIVFAPGLPQYITKYHPLIRKLAGMNYNVFVPQYYGSFKSKGTFTLANSIKTISDTIDFVRKGQAGNLYDNSLISWKPAITLIGFSYGGLPSLMNANKVKKIVLISPLIDYKIHLKFGGEDLRRTFEFARRAFSYKLSPEDLLKEFEEFNYEKTASFTIIHGSEDKSIPLEEIKEVARNTGARLIMHNSGHTSNIPEEVLRDVLLSE